jgi:hypothetical protein
VSNPVQRMLCSMVLAAVAVAPGAAQQTASIATAHQASPVHRCPGTLVDVTAASSLERSLGCSAAIQAMELLGRCQISLRRPLDVQIGNKLRHPLGWPVLAFFDAVGERVFSARYENMPSLVAGTPFAALSQHALFQSIILHEIIHGVLHQNAGDHIMSHTAGEYLSYALQLEALSAQERHKFIKAVKRRVSTTELVFTDALLSLDPFFFAAHAYEHLKASPDSCDRVRALRQGEVPFISTLQY